MSKINPKIICCSITGTGPSGPYVKRPAYDTVGQGMGGMMSVLMDPKESQAGRSGLRRLLERHVLGA